MPKIYYLDTCIWRDHFENRLGLKGKPLGDYATKLFIKIIKDHDIILFSEFVVRELQSDIDKREITDMLNILFINGILKHVDIREEDYKDAKKIGAERNLPTGDVLHAILAKKNNAVFVSQDEHCKQLKDIVEVKKPEEII